MKTSYWAIKSEPEVYPFAQLVKEKRTAWTGIRNFEARNNLRAMAVGDLCLYYHSGKEKAFVGVARVVKAAYADPTAKGEAKDRDWSAVDVAAERALAKPVPLSVLKANKRTAGMELVRRSRLSVTRVTAAELEAIDTLGRK